MAFKLVKRNKLPVLIKGELMGEDGKMVQFSFTLHCKRLTQGECDDELKDRDGSVKAFLLKVAEGWDGMLDESGVAIAFSEEAFGEVLNDTAGLHSVCYQAYLKAVGAVAKN